MFNLGAFNPAALKELGVLGGGGSAPTNTGFGGGRLGGLPKMFGGGLGKPNLPPPAQGFIGPMMQGPQMPMQNPQMGMQNPRQPKPGNMGVRPRGRMF